MKKNFVADFSFKSIIWVSIVFLILFLSAISCSEAHSSADDKYVSVEQGNIEDLVIAQGKVEPMQYVDVGAQVSGQLKKIYSELGSKVKKADLLAEIDPTVYQSQVEVAQARVKTLQAQQRQQEAQVRFQVKQYERNKRLHDSQAGSREAMEESQTALEVAQAQVESIKAQLEESFSTLKGNQANLNYTKIFAPMDGTIVSQTAREGQTLNANQLAPTILQLADLSSMTVRAQVAEADVLRLKEGMSVYFSVLGDNERRWTAKLRQILPSPEVINDVVLYNALIDVDNSDGQLMSGMSTQIFFVVLKSDNTLLLPMQALGLRHKEQDSLVGKAYSVKTKNGEKIIHVGIMNRTLAEVKEGLSLGDQVERKIDSEAASKNPGQARMRPPAL